MRSRCLPLLLAVVLGCSVLGPVTATADDGRAGEGAATAEVGEPDEVLAQAEALFGLTGPASRRLAPPPASEAPDATMLLNQLLRVYPDLDASQRATADALLARPTDTGGDVVAGRRFAYEDGEADPVCGGIVCVHYAVAADDDAPPGADVSPENDIPDAVDQSLTVAEEISTIYRAAGYARPAADGGRGGGADRVDVYLADLGTVGLYGYCTSDRTRGPSVRAAYCVIDDDFSEEQFGRNTPVENREVTIAHEYFHAVQFGYDFFEDPWLMEATATWVEDEVYDDIDDNHQYLDNGQLRRPGIPLDLFGGNGNYYGNWIFVRHLTERFPQRTGGLPTLVLDLWRRLGTRSGQPDDYSTQGLQAVLTDRGSGFARGYADFAVDNRLPAERYEEGDAAAYAPAQAAVSRLGPARRQSSVTSRLDHLTHRTLRYVPDGTDSVDWQLRLSLDLSDRVTAPAARLLRFDTSGQLLGERPIRLSRTGAGRATVGFSTRQVSRVELVLVNASRRTRCNRGSPYACAGQPRDDRLPMRVTARVSR